MTQPKNRQLLIDQWKNKVRKRTASRPHVGKWAEHLFMRLLCCGPIEGKDMRSLVASSGVPLKFLPRALAVLHRFGLVITRRRGQLVLIGRLPRMLKPRKIGEPRVRISEQRRKTLIELDCGICAACGKPHKSDNLVLDHIIPLAFGGADDLGNLTIMSKNENARKWEDFATPIKWYRGKRVLRAVGMRWRNGAFWPVINGKPRYRRWT